MSTRLTSEVTKIVAIGLVDVSSRVQYLTSEVTTEAITEVTCKVTPRVTHELAPERTPKVTLEQIPEPTAKVTPEPHKPQFVRKHPPFSGQTLDYKQLYPDKTFSHGQTVTQTQLVRKKGTFNGRFTLRKFRDS